MDNLISSCSEKGVNQECVVCRGSEAHEELAGVFGLSIVLPAANGF